MTVAVGDFLTFTWPGTGTHNVNIHPSASCDATDSIPIGDTSRTNLPISTGARRQPRLFVCQVGTHCVWGRQKVNIEVVPAKRCYRNSCLSVPMERRPLWMSLPTAAPIFLAELPLPSEVLWLRVRWTCCHVFLHVSQC